MMIKLAVLFALIFATAAAVPLSHVNKKSAVNRIIGGTATTIENVPYLVSVRVLGSHYCGGSIISANWIITAAQCTIFSPSWYTIRAGSSYSNTDGTVHEVASVSVHPNYGSNAFYLPVNDISLIQLSTSITLDSTRAIIPLYTSGEIAVTGAPGVVSGWGALEWHGHYSTELQTTSVPIVSKDDCNTVYTNWGGIPDNQICAGGTGVALGGCQGDLGGPLAVHSRLAGIVSWDYDCHRYGVPGVYTEVAAHRAWITSISGV